MRSTRNRITFIALLAGTLAVSTTFGMLLLLPLYIKEKLGGTEADFGLISAAGAITAAIAIGILIRYPRRIPPHFILAITAAIYAAAAFSVSLTHTFAWPLIVLGLVLGTAWAVAYTSAPMVASELSDNETRSKNIGYVTGMVQIGFGAGPLLGDLLIHQGLSFSGIFRVAAVLSLLAALVVFPLHFRSPELRPRGVADSEPPLGPALMAILRSRAAIPLLTILLCACLFTTMNSFQTTFAASRGLSFGIFYACYTLAVIFARFVLAPLLRDSGSPRILAIASSGIVVSILLFIWVGRSGYLYGVASVALGVTYGLTLPALQGGAVNASADNNRLRILPIAGLLFEVAILAFPLASGEIITRAGYTVVFIVLLVFAVAIAGLGARLFMSGADTRPARIAPATAGVSQSKPD
jgi:predicted MFS family arabinose efflux permease